MVEFTIYAAKTNEPLECKAMIDAFLRLYPSRRQAIIDLLKLQPETEEVIKFLEKA